MLVSCSTESSKTQNEQALQTYLNKLEITYESICKQAGTEVWEYYSDSSKNSMTAYKELFSNFILNDSLIKNINTWYTRSNQLSNDTIIKRLELWKRVITCAQVDFDPEIVTLQNTLESQLANYPSEEITDDKLEQSVIRLIKLRNAKAKKLGFDNYAYMLLKNSGISIQWFEDLIQTIDSSSKKSYRRFIEDHFPGKLQIDYEDLRPHIYASYMINENPVIKDDKKEELIHQLLLNMGIDINKLPMQFRVTDLPPGIGGFGNGIDIPNDFRAVATKELSFYYLLHEIGHGLHWTNVSVKHPMLKGYEWFTGNLNDIISESSGEIIAKFSQNKMWLQKNGFTNTQIDSINKHRREINPVILRLGLITALFEIELYKQPEKAPAIIKNKLYKKYLYVDKDFSTKPNLIQLSYVSYPIYEQNYLIADIIAWQVHEYLENKYGENYVFNLNVGGLLKEKLWRNGEFHDWQKRIQIVTGEKLNIKGYLNDILQ